MKPAPPVTTSFISIPLFPLELEDQFSVHKMPGQCFHGSAGLEPGMCRPKGRRYIVHPIPGRYDGSSPRKFGVRNAIDATNLLPPDSWPGAATRTSPRLSTSLPEDCASRCLPS